MKCYSCGKDIKKKALICFCCGAPNIGKYKKIVLKTKNT